MQNLEDFKVGKKIIAMPPDKSMIFEGTIAKLQKAGEELTQGEIEFYFEAKPTDPYYDMLKVASIDRVIIEKENGTGYTLSACYLAKVVT